MIPESLASTDQTGLYTFIGGLIVINIAAIGSSLATVIRLAFKAGQVENRIVKLEKDMNNSFKMHREKK